MRSVPFVKPTGGTQTAPSAEETVATNCDGSIASGRASGRGGRGWKRSDEVAADHDFLLDDRLAAEHDVLGADERSFARHLVARVLCGSRV